MTVKLRDPRGAATARERGSGARRRDLGEVMRAMRKARSAAAKIPDFDRDAGLYGTTLLVGSTVRGVATRPLSPPLFSGWRLVPDAWGGGVLYAGDAPGFREELHGPRAAAARSC